MKVLVTGGAGYIGSHTSLLLLEAGHQVIVIDNLCNSSVIALQRVQQLTAQSLRFHKVDLRDKAAVYQVFQQEQPDAVIHFAGLKAVGESVTMPLHYYHNNLTGTLVLCEAMAAHAVKRLVFSSSATVYGDPQSVPISEDFPLSATNPYGQTKLMIETILRDVYRADDGWDIALLRYFNPVGAHDSGHIGESPKGMPNNLMPFISQVAVGKRPQLSVFGNDYPTPDGTGVRDYIHVMDLASGHLKALDKLQSAPGLVVYNLGTGQGYSVLDMIKGFEQASGKTVPYEIVERRPGDIATCYADPRKAQAELGWRAERGLPAMCEDTWRWQRQNPHGFD